MATAWLRQGARPHPAGHVWSAAAGVGQGAVGNRVRRDLASLRATRKRLGMADPTKLTTLLVVIANLDHKAAVDLLNATPSLATVGVERREEFFLAERLAQVYEGDTALHAAAFSYDSEMAGELIGRGADVRARNRRGCRTASRRGH